MYLNGLAESIVHLQSRLYADTPEKTAIISKAGSANAWFIPEFVQQALTAIAAEYLDIEKYEAWRVKYPAQHIGQRTIALIMAGNIPLAGFHDLLCVLTSGHSAQIKLSDKDPYLLPFITATWKEIFPVLEGHITYVEKIEGYDAVIATGSNNSARYFEYYFRHVPHLLRKNRNAVAVLTGNETTEELKSLATDIFYYFGQGCRNVSKVYVPRGYDFTAWRDAMEDWGHLGDHHKYKNNLDYNTALYHINNIPHIHLGHLILLEDDAIASRIGCIHYSYYDDLSSVADVLHMRRQEIQCVISAAPVDGCEPVLPGKGQCPQIDQYADGVDTMEFLLHSVA